METYSSMAVRWLPGRLGSMTARVAILALAMVALLVPATAVASTWSLQSTLDPEALPPESRMAGVACPTASLCPAVGYDSSRAKTIFRLWNGSEWKAPSSETPSGTPADIACASTTSCIVVGTSSKGSAKAETWSTTGEGKPWTRTEPAFPAPTGSLYSTVSSVSCTSTSACTAVGYYIDASGRNLTLAERWNGSAWSIQTTANPASGNTELRGVSCNSSTSCTAVGRQASGLFAERWNGSAWSISPTPNPEGTITNFSLNEVSCTTSSFCLAVGGYSAQSPKQTLVERWNGSAWSLISSPNPSGGGAASLTDVSCATAESCDAVGSYNVSSTSAETRSLVESWNGSAMAIQASPNPAGKAVVQLADVSCATSSACESVGYSETAVKGPAAGTLGEGWNGSTWSLQSTPDPEALPPESRLAGVACPTASLCPAIGYDSSRAKTIFRLWNGSEWKAPSSEAPGGTPADIACASTTSCIVVGTSSEGRARAEAWSTTGEGQPWVRTAQTLVTPSGATNVVISSVSCTSTSACTAVGYYTNSSARIVTLAERWNGSAWSVQTTANPASGSVELLGVSCNSSTSCTAVGNQASGTFAERWNGSAWSISSTPNPTGFKGSVGLSDVSCVNSTFCLAVSNYLDSGSTRKTLVERWNGSAWSLISSPNPSGGGAYLTDVSCAEISGCSAVGYYYVSSSSSEARTLVETWGGSAMAIQTSPNPAGKAVAQLNDVSCATPSACESVGYSETSVGGPAAGTLGMGFNEGDSSAPYITNLTGPGGVINYNNPTFTFDSNEARSTFECSMDYVSVACSSPKAYEHLSEGLHNFRVRATDVSGNVGGWSHITEQFEVDTTAPQTTITSPLPSYTAHEEWPVTFSSSEVGSKLECKLDSAKFAPCTSPYTLPKKLGEGWHVFEVKATDKAGNPDPTPARWRFNEAIYPAASSLEKFSSPTEGAKTASHLTLSSQSPYGSIKSVAYQVKLPAWSAFKYIPTQYLLDEKGNHPGAQIPMEAGHIKSPSTLFDLKAYAEAEGWPALVEGLQLRTVFNSEFSSEEEELYKGQNVGEGASDPVTITYSRFAGGPNDATEQVGPANVDLLTGAFTITRSDVSIPVPGTKANLEFTRTYNSAYGANERTNSKTLGQMWQPSAPVESEYSEEAWQKLLTHHIDRVPANFEQYRWNEETETESYETCAEGTCGACPAYNEETGIGCEEWMIEAEIPEQNWVEVLNSEGAGIPFERTGSKAPYSYVAPAEAKEYALSESEGKFVLTESGGTHTTFSQLAGAAANEYQPSAVSFAGTANTSALEYDTSEGKMRLKKIVGPAPAGVKCNPSKAEEGGANYAPTTKGCRTLELNYISFNIEGGSSQQRLDHITYYDSSGSGTGQTVARYSYDSASGNLTAEWDPRIGELKERYGYASTADARLTSVEAPGTKPWQLGYYPAGSGGAYEAKLKSVTRASLLKEGPENAITTIAYGVPLSGAGAPYDLSPSRAAEWGQSDYPVEATAIFPPTEVPGSEPPSDYSQAAVHYMDPGGYESNVASAAPPGVAGDAITTSETDAHGNVVRELGAQARLEALASKEPAVRSRELDTHSTYDETGTRMLESWGPLHQIRLASTGETVEARRHTTVVYDKGFKLITGHEVYPNLPTKETTAAIIPGKEGEFEPQVTETHYDWNLLEPIESITDPGSEAEGHLNLIAKTAYNGAGQVIEERQPANAEGSANAGTTKTEYYVATGQTGENPCYGHAAWAGLPCVTKLAADPSPEGSRSTLPVSSFAKYSTLDQPEEIQEKTGGVLKRTSTLTYDGAGRPLTTLTTGTEGTAVPKVETTYSTETGAPLSQQFVCESKCEGFDQQQTRVEYDALGRPIKYFDADGNESAVAYDLLGRPVLVTDGKGAQTLKYDEKSGVETEATDSAAGAFKATYNADGQMISQLLPNGLSQRLEYNPEGTAVGLKYVKETSCSSACEWLTFARKDSIAGQVLKEEGTLGTYEYSYDKAGRLTLSKETPATEGCTTRAYTFDKDSNRLSKTTRPPKTGGACDTESAGTKIGYEYDSADRLINSGVVYDTLGRITTLPSTYSGGGGAWLTTSYYVNDLTRSQTQEGVTNTYNLDASLRQRERVRTGGTEAGTAIYHYAAGSDTPAWTQEGSNWSRNIAAIGGSIGALQKSTGEVTLQLADMHGDTVATVEDKTEAKGLLDSQRFDEFGNPLTPGFLTGGKAEYGWLGAKGRRTQLASGVIQMGKRSYVPALGRFLTPDPVKGGSANAYDYADQDPVNQFDLTGEFSACIVKWVCKRAAHKANKQHIIKIRFHSKRELNHFVSWLVQRGNLIEKLHNKKSWTASDIGKVSKALQEFHRLPGQVYPTPTVDEGAGTCFKASTVSTGLAIATAPVTGTVGAWVFGIASLGFAFADKNGVC